MSHNYEAQRRETIATFKGVRGLPETSVVEFLFFLEEIDADWKAFDAALRKAGALGMTTNGRPSKKQRRQIEHFRGAQEQ